MGAVAEQFKDVVSAVNNQVEFVQMWVGPKSADEITKAIEGNPTLVPCAIGPNLNDGDGVHGYKKRKGFYTLEEMYRWVKDQDPEQQKFPCPKCPVDAQFIGKTANELVTHMDDEHPPENLVKSFDAEGAYARKHAKELEDVGAKREEIEARITKATVATTGTAVDTQCAATKPDGERCTKEAKPDSNYCGIASHQKQGEAS